jgi:hypothetical protein
MGVSGQRYAYVALSPAKTTGANCTAGWVDPRAGLGECGKFHSHRDSITTSVQPDASRHTYYAIRASFV